MKIKSKAENRNSKSHNLTIGIFVLFQQTKIDKWTPPYESKHYIVYKIRGATIWARRVTDGREVCRDSTCLKKVNRPRGLMITHTMNNNRSNTDDWREITLRKARTRITREHENNTVTDAITNEVHDVEPEEAEPLLRRSHQIRRSRMGTLFITNCYTIY